MKLYRTPVLSFSAAHGCCLYTHIYTHIYTHTHIYIYVCMYVLYMYTLGRDTTTFKARAGGSALRAVTASAGNAQEKYGGDQMVEPLQ